MSLRFVHIMSLSLVRNSVYFILLLFFSYFRSLISFTMSCFINIMPFPSTCIMCTYHSFGEFACVLCCVISPVPVASIRQAWFAHYARLNQDVWRYLRSVIYIFHLNIQASVKEVNNYFSQHSESNVSYN